MFVKRAVFVIFVATFVANSVLGKPASDKTSPIFCYELNCPESTQVCGKTSELSSTDKTKLNVQIKCLDGQGNILSSKNTTEDNPFGPVDYYKGTKLSSVIKPDSFFLDFSKSDSDDDDLIPIFFTHGHHDYSDYYPSKPKTGPKSEVEDLNNR